MPPTEKEKSQKFQEKYQAILSALLKEDDNKYCADCDAKGPRWASWNLGVFVCIRCAGIHRNLGVHISRVKSVNLDQWTAEQIASMQAVGNAKSRSIYECNIPDTFRRSQTDSAMEQFIRSKYESRKWIAKEWTQPTITVSADLKEDMDANSKRKSKSGAVNLDSAFSSMKLDAQPKQKKTSKPASSPTSKAPEPKINESSLLDLESNDVFSSSNGTSQQSANQLDLFNLGQATETTTSTTEQTNDSIFPVDFLNNIAPADMVDTGTKKEASSYSVNSDVSGKPSENSDFADLMSDTPATATGNKCMDKNSILALYGQAKPATNSFPTSSSTNMFPNQQNNFMNTNSNTVPNTTNFMSNNNNQFKTSNQQASNNFGMNQMNMFGQNPYNQKVTNPPANSNSQDLFDAFSGMNLSSSSTNVPNIGNTLSTNLWQ